MKGLALVGFLAVFLAACSGIGLTSDAGHDGRDGAGTVDVPPVDKSGGDDVAARHDALDASPPATDATGSHARERHRRGARCRARRRERHRRGARCRAMPPAPDVAPDVRK